MKILVLTSDKYLPAVRVFAWLFQKYWGPDQPVVVAGFTPPSFSLPDTFEFVSIGEFDDYPLQRWSNAFRKALIRLGSDRVIVFLEDYWLTRGVDVEAVKMAWDYVGQFGYVARFDLTGDVAGKGEGNVGFHGFVKRPSDGTDMRLLKSRPGAPYHMSMMAAVWNVDHLLSILRPGETPWEVEIKGTPRLSARGNDVIVLGYEKEWQPVEYTLGLRGGNSDTLTDELPGGDREELSRLGLLDPWEDD